MFLFYYTSPAGRESYSIYDSDTLQPVLWMIPGFEGGGCRKCQPFFLNHLKLCRIYRIHFIIVCRRYADS